MHNSNGDICFCLSCMEEATRSASFSGTLRDLGAAMLAFR
jgi:hypothetical protein